MTWRAFVKQIDERTWEWVVHHDQYGTAWGESLFKESAEEALRTAVKNFAGRPG